MSNCKNCENCNCEPDPTRRKTLGVIIGVLNAAVAIPILGPVLGFIGAPLGKKRDGQFIEQVGTYDPMSSPHRITFKQERYDYWVSVGAQPSDTVNSLYKRFVKSAAQAEA